MSKDNMILCIQKYFATQPVVKAWLFGSYSRGEEGPDSNVNILVAFDKDAHVGLLKYCGMICDLGDILKKKVELVEDGTLMPFAVESVNRDKILIYENRVSNASNMKPA